MDELPTPASGQRQRLPRASHVAGERLRDIASSQTHRASSSKRKQVAQAAEASAQSRKKRRVRAPAPKTGISTNKKPQIARSANQKAGKTTKTAPIFSRSADPSVQSPGLKARVKATGSAAAMLEASFAAKYNPTGASLLETPPTRHERLKEEAPARLTSTGGAHGVVDLNEVDVNQMEMVEGNDILQALMRSSHPRVGRQFPSEEALTDSEKKDREVIRRRRMKLRSEYSAMKVKPRIGEDEAFRLDEEAAFVIPTRSAGVEGGLFQPAASEEKRKSPVVQKEAGGETEASSTDKDEERARLEEEEAETDEETTESKIERLSNAMHLNWRQFLMWLVSGSLLLCVLVVATPFAMKMLEPPLPYCDSVWREESEGTYVLADPADHFDRSKALQPFIGNTAMAASASKAICQPCPVYGSCLNGAVISCAPPYELQYGLCVENPQVQEDLDQLALSIQNFVIEEAAQNACDNVSLWRYLFIDKSAEPTNDLTASIEVLLSDVQVFLTRTISFGKAVTKLPRDYVFNRALDMALRELKDIFVTEDQTQLVVGGGVVPWSCRAKHQLYSHVKLIALAVALGTALVFGYRQFLLYRTERQLVDRFVKEVRFFLLDRTRNSDRFYPADHLRDNLLDKQYPRQHTWLRKSVWPKVVAIVNGDSRVRSSIKRVKGEDLVVWEWVSSTSPTSRRTGAGRGQHGFSRPRQAATHFSRPVAAKLSGPRTRQRKKPTGSRASLP